MADDTGLRQAAERRRSTLTGDWSAYETPECKQFFDEHLQTQCEADDEVLARAYLAEHPADDGEPVTEEWLRSVGATKNDHPNKVTFHREDAMSVGLWHVDDGWKAVLVHHDHAASCIVRALLARGDVRRLLAALGLPLPTPGETR